VERALVLAPNDPSVISSAGELQFALGRMDEMVAISEHLARQDPLSPNAHNELGLSYYFRRRYDDAIASFRNALALSPDFPGGHAETTLALLKKGEGAAAEREIRQETSENWRMSVQPMVEAALGRRAASDALLDSLHAKFGHDTAYFTAMTYAFRNEPEAAFAWLQKAIEYEDPVLAELHAEPMFDPIRTDAHWLPFLRKTGQAPDQLTTIRFDYDRPKE
jgi:serine/threonine-protein kinase